MWEGSDIIFPDRVWHFFVYTFWKLGSSLSCKLAIYNMCFTYVCGTEGRGTSHHRVCWSYHTSNHMAHSVRRRTLENTTEMKILVCIATQAVVQLCATKHQLCMLPVWKYNGRTLFLLYIRTASALLNTLYLRVQCETGIILTNSPRN